MTVARDRLLRSKNEEIATILTSRKRKLRELYAVAQYAEPIPLQPGFDDNTPYDNGEVKFLELNDITKGRPFDENTIPVRRDHPPNFDRKERRPETLSWKSDTGVTSRVVEGNDAGSFGPDSTSLGVGRSELSNDDADLPLKTRKTPIGITRSPRPTRSSPTKLKHAVTRAPSGIVDEVVEDARGFSREDMPGDGYRQLPLSDLEQNRIRSTVESREGSPGIDPQKTVEWLENDEACVATTIDEKVGKALRSEGSGDARPLISGSPVKSTHRSDRVAEGRTDRRPDGRPPDTPKHHALAQRDTGIPSISTLASTQYPQYGVSAPLLTTSLKPAEVISPSSSVGQYSTNTPGPDHASTDTSPDNDVSLEGAESFLTNGTLERHFTPQKETQSTQKQRQQAPADIAILNSGKNTRLTPNSQLQSEERQAAALLQKEPSSAGHTLNLAVENSLTSVPSKNTQDVADDEEDEVVGVPTPEDEAAPNMSENSAVQTASSSEQTQADGSILRPPTTTFGSNFARGTDSTQGIAALTSGEKEESVPAEAGTSLDRDLSSLEQSSNNALQLNKFETRNNDVPLPDGTLTPKKPAEVLPSEGSKMDYSGVLSTPARPAPFSSVQSPPERMTTRVSSGAIRHKSVSEILGEVPKSTSSPPALTTDNSGTGQIVESTITVDNRSSPSSPPFMLSRPSDRRNRDRDRDRNIKLSHVIFPKQNPIIKDLPSSDLTMSKGSSEHDDYLLTLFAAQASQKPRSQSLSSLLAGAPKALTTAEHYVDFHEQQDCRVLKKIYQMQYHQRWSLRQMERSTEPPRPAAHWDILLDQMKWMRTDFREERKWKIIIAKGLADACAIWKAAGMEDRLAMQVRTRPVQHDGAAGQVGDRDIEMTDEHQLTPDLVPSGADGSVSDIPDDEDPHVNLDNTVAPMAIFSLGPQDVVFKMHESPSSTKMLQDLPSYGPPADVPDHDSSISSPTPDRSWKLPMANASKFVTGKLVVNEVKLPRKRSRYEYEPDDNEPMDTPRIGVPPEQRDIALFNPEHKHILDRLHAGHAFKPPIDHPMPSQSFFESRTPSQWTYSEDDELKKLVKEHSYHWSLISDMLTSQSIYSSGYERRTPWECFERWIQLEGLPADMQKTAYFRAYSSRMEAAQRTITLQAQQVQAAQAASGGPITRRRTSSSPTKVDRRRSTKYLALVDGMRKLAKKRESTNQKHLQAAGNQAARKASEIPQTRRPAHTPQDFSRMKHERELKFQEKHEAYRQVMAQQKAAAMQQRSAQQASSQQNASSNGTGQPVRNVSSNPVNGGSPVAGSANPVGQYPGVYAGQQLPQPSAGAPPNGGIAQPPSSLPSNVNVQLHMMNQGYQKQPQMAANRMAQQRLQKSMVMTPDMRILMENTRISNEQRILQQARQQAQNQGLHMQGQPGQRNHLVQSSSPNLGHVNGIGSNAALQNNAAALAALQAASAANGMQSSAFGNMPVASSASPRPTSAHLSQPNQPQALSNGMVPAINAISHQIKARNPQISPENLKRLVDEQFRQSYIPRNTMATATGGSPQHPQMNLMQASQAPGGQTGNEHQYAQLLAMQQEQQFMRNRTISVTGRPASRSATPQTQRSSSVQTGQGVDQSPRPNQAQLAGG